jgi:RimJ/RimL family protein N-acetyltransferase
MARILRNERVDAAVAWAKERIGAEGIGNNCSAVSVVDDNDRFIAVCIFSSYIGTNVDMHLAAERGTNWLSRSYFHAVMYLPFEVLQVSRITGLIRGSNLDTQRFAGRMGFQYEGRMRKVFEDGDDLVLYGFLREEYERHPWRK